MAATSSDLIALEKRADALLDAMHSALKAHLDPKATWGHRVLPEAPHWAHILDRAWTQAGQAHGNIGKALESLAADEARQAAKKVR